MGFESRKPSWSHFSFHVNAVCIPAILLLTVAGASGLLPESGCNPDVQVKLSLGKLAYTSNLLGSHSVCMRPTCLPKTWAVRVRVCVCTQVFVHVCVLVKPECRHVEQTSILRSIISEGISSNELLKII